MNENLRSPAADALRKWCASQERSTQDALEKLRRLGVEGGEAAGVIAQLVSEDFLNEGRFAESFVRARAEHKAWGPAKIRAGLRAKGVSSAEIERAMEAQRPGVFSQGLERLVERRAHELPEGRDRVVRWLLGRGFPLGEVLAALAPHERAG